MNPESGLINFQFIKRRYVFRWKIENNRATNRLN